METNEMDAWDIVAPASKLDSFSPSSTGTNCNSNSNDSSDNYRGSLSPCSEAQAGAEHSMLEISFNGQGCTDLVASPEVRPKVKKYKGSSSPNDNKGSDRKLAQQLPPCLICGGNSSGFHFGVITCESCKVFFRRSLTRDTSSYFCSRAENCVISPGKRSNCSFCRLKKCVQLGMSKDGVKKGRYTLERKHDYQTMVETHEIEVKEKREDQVKQKQMHQETISVTIERLKALHKKHKMVTPEVWERIKMGEIRRKEYKIALEEAMGPTPPITPKEATEFIKTTGIDITGYRDIVKPCAKTCPDMYSFGFMNYLKDLDEFMVLSLPDRITVTKGSINVWLYMIAYELVNLEDYTFSCMSCGNCFSEDEYKVFSDVIEFRSYFAPTIKMQNLNLTEDEKAVLCAFVIFDTSQYKDDVQEPEKIDSAQNLFLECLLQVMEESRGKENVAKTYAAIINVLSESRRMEAEKYEMIDKAVELFSDIKYSKLSAELYDLPDACVEDLGNDLNNLQL